MVVVIVDGVRIYLLLYELTTSAKEVGNSSNPVFEDLNWLVDGWYLAHFNAEGNKTSKMLGTLPF